MSKESLSAPLSPMEAMASSTTEVSSSAAENCCLDFCALFSRFPSFFLAAVRALMLRFFSSGVMDLLWISRIMESREPVSIFFMPARSCLPTRLPVGSTKTPWMTPGPAEAVSGAAETCMVSAACSSAGEVFTGIPSRVPVGCTMPCFCCTT